MKTSIKITLLIMAAILAIAADSLMYSINGSNGKNSFKFMSNRYHLICYGCIVKIFTNN